MRGYLRDISAMLGEVGADRPLCPPASCKREEVCRVGQRGGIEIPSGNGSSFDRTADRGPIREMIASSASPHGLARLFLTRNRGAFGRTQTTYSATLVRADNTLINLITGIEDNTPRDTAIKRFGEWCRKNGYQSPRVEKSIGDREVS